MTDVDSNVDAEPGVEFDRLERELESHDYPTTRSELREVHGKRVVKHSQGELTFRQILESLDEDEQFGSPAAVREAIVATVRAEIVDSEQYGNRSADEVLDEDEV
ncbi:hypothetical protein SAMN04487948_107121 [Halogranum amylolyticum]|uniref:DUF2795 domain-containing protein n=1 Tax=Halogranum amylolyticum TaxID=660520 RepID=A0A1H8TL70_9EURY|nr:hypothetical protein [Halogranum amylolyticum]SEO91228.1 hypothetical protein SAMN04487948_107121 [Halogranum amylolyticum]